MTNEWQPIETPPTNDDEVVVLMSNGDHEIGFWCEDVKAFDSYTGWLKDATHWMPLPDPPNDEGLTVQ